MTERHFPKVVDSSMLNAYRQCRRKFFHSHVLGIAPSAISPDLLAGGAFSDGIRAVREAFYIGGKTLDESLAKGFQAMIRAYGEYEPPDKIVRGKPTTHPKTFENMFYALESYFVEEYPPDQDPVQPYLEFERPFEFSFAIPLDIPHPQTNDRLFFGGRFDMVGKFGELAYPVDEKTTASGLYNFGKKWKMRGQFLGYTWALRTAHDIPSPGVIVRGINIQKTQIQHQQVLILYPDHLIDRWVGAMLRDVYQMTQDFEAAWFEYNFGESCDTMFGGCEFTSLCQSQEPELVYPSYEQRRWDPMANDPTHTKEYLKTHIKRVDEGEISLAEFVAGL